ncbi:hypothetical protein ACWDGI_13710 [Streptomyces sp. NPDC001220]
MTGRVYPASCSPGRPPSSGSGPAAVVRVRADGLGRGPGGATHLEGPCDVPAEVVASSSIGAGIGCGPRGPQHRDNARLRPA